MNLANRHPELEAIADLCRELAKLGLSVGMSDARPALVIRGGAVSPVWITVDASGTRFEWNETETHPVSDLAGAAAFVAERFKSQASRTGDVP
jgi:hypothetical protein